MNVFLTIKINSLEVMDGFTVIAMNGILYTIKLLLWVYNTINV